MISNVVTGHIGNQRLLSFETIVQYLSIFHGHVYIYL